MEVHLAADATVHANGRASGSVRREPRAGDALDAAGREALARAVERRFQGGLLVHMKRSSGADRFARQAGRWAAQGRVSRSLSYSLVHPRLAAQKLWVQEGWLLDPRKCEPFAGGTGDLWTHNEVQHGQEATLDAGRNGELLRLALVQQRRLEKREPHAGVRPGGVHLAVPRGAFVAWARDPARWSAAERAALLAASPYGENSTVAEVPSPGAISAVLEGHAFAAGVPGLVQELLADAEQQLVERFTEVLAACPLDAVLGFVARRPRGRPGGIDAAKAQAVLAAASEHLPQPLVAAEYEFEPEVDLAKLDPEGVGATPPRIRFLPPFQASLRVLGVHTDTMHWRGS